MKLTRRQLKKIIAEAINEGRFIIVDPKDKATRGLDALKTGQEKDKQALGVDDNLDDFLRSKDPKIRKQGRELAMSMGFQDELTPAEEIAVDQLSYRLDYDSPLESSIYTQNQLYNAISGRHAPSLKKIGFRYIRDIGYNPEADYDDFGPMFRFQAKVLDTNVDNLAFMDNDWDDYSLFRHIHEVLMSAVKKGEAVKQNISNDTGSFGQNALYNWDGTLILITSHMGGYSTLTIAG